VPGGSDRSLKRRLHRTDDPQVGDELQPRQEHLDAAVQGQHQGVEHGAAQGGQSIGSQLVRNISFITNDLLLLLTY